MVPVLRNWYAPRLPHDNGKSIISLLMFVCASSVLFILKSLVRADSIVETGLGFAVTHTFSLQK
jgi:hypothetical protein